MLVSTRSDGLKGEGATVVGEVEVGCDEAVGEMAGSVSRCIDGTCDVILALSSYIGRSVARMRVTDK